MEKWRKQLGKIPSNYEERMDTVIALIFARNFSGLDWKKLRGYENLFRVRVGIYRIIYRDDGKEIAIISISPKGDSTYNDL